MMLNRLKIAAGEFVHQLKLSCQVPSFVEAVLMRQIITSAAQEANIQIDPTELQQAADGLRSQYALWSAEVTWAWLQKHHLSLDDFEEMAHHTLLATKLAQHLFEAAVEPFFAEHLLDYVQVVLYEVILDNQDLAIELFYAFQEQEISFPEIAHRYISDPELRRKGGYRGILKRADLKPEIAAAVFAAQPPQILRPIAIGKTSSLIFVEEIIQPTLDTELRSQILTELFNGWMKQQVEEAIDEVEVEL
jgi:parvulin-like peptidyl-prolyl isomerase